MIILFSVSRTNGVRKSRYGDISDGSDSLDEVGPQQPDQLDTSFDTPISITGENPTDRHYINEDFLLLNSRSSKTKSTTVAAGFFKNVQPVLLSGVMKDWEPSTERFSRKYSTIHDAKDSVPIPQLANDIIHSPIHYFKGNLIFMLHWIVGLITAIG